MLQIGSSINIGADADKEYHWWLEDGKQPQSYYCKDRFP